MVDEQHIERQKEGFRRSRHIKICKAMVTLGYCGKHSGKEQNKWICMRGDHSGSAHNNHFLVAMSRFTLKNDGTLLKDGKPVEKHEPDPWRRKMKV